MSILEKLNKAIMEKDGAAAGELVHEDYKMFSHLKGCLLYTSPSPRDQRGSRMPSSA